MKIGDIIQDPTTLPAGCAVLSKRDGSVWCVWPGGGMDYCNTYNSPEYPSGNHVVREDAPFEVLALNLTGDERAHILSCDRFGEAEEVAREYGAASLAAPVAPASEIDTLRGEIAQLTTRLEALERLAALDTALLRARQQRSNP